MSGWCLLWRRGVVSGTVALRDYLSGSAVIHSSACDLTRNNEDCVFYIHRPRWPKLGPPLQRVPFLSVTICESFGVIRAMGALLRNTSTSSMCMSRPNASTPSDRTKLKGIAIIDVATCTKDAPSNASILSRSGSTAPPPHHFLHKASH